MRISFREEGTCELIKGTQENQKGIFRELTPSVPAGSLKEAELVLGTRLLTDLHLK